MSHERFSSRVNGPTVHQDNRTRWLDEVTPRHLAGGGDPRHVTEYLSVSSDPACAQTQRISPDLSARLEVASQFTPSRWWYLTAKPPKAPTWAASFSRQVPAEVLAGLTDTLLTPTPADVPDPWDLFRRAGWSVTQSENGTGHEALSPDRRVVVEYSRPHDIELASFSWRIRAKKYPSSAGESVLNGPAVWDGWLDQPTPAHAVAGFITALASAEPLLRGWGQHGWPFGVQHERTHRTGTVVADTHQQRIKEIQARIRAARRPPPGYRPLLSHPHPHPRPHLGRDADGGTPPMSKKHPFMTTLSRPGVLHQQRLDQLAAFVRTSEQLLDAWDAYSDQHTDPDGWPHDDESYGRRAARRDADTWEAAARIRPFARELISTAALQLQHLLTRTIQPAWPWHLSAADDALGQLDAFEADFRARLDELPPSAGPQTAAYDDLVDARNAEAWHALNELALHAPAILAIHATAQSAPHHLDTVAPRPAPAGSASPASAGRR